MNYLLLLSALLTTTLSVAQAITNSSGTYTSITIYDPYQAAYNDIGGSPYLPEKGFVTGFIPVNGGAMQTLKVRYNTEAGQLEYLEKSKVLRMTSPANEFRMVLAEADTALFRNGFTGKGDLTRNPYCQVLYDGKKSKLIRMVSSTIKTDEEKMSSDYGKRRFVQRSQYYIVVANVPTAVTASKSSITDAFPADQRDAFTTILSKQTGKIKNWVDVKQVLTAYEAN